MAGQMRESDRRKAKKRGITIGPHAKPRATVLGSWSAVGASSPCPSKAGTGYTLRSKLAENVAPDRPSTPTTTRATTVSGASFTHHTINHTGRVYVVVRSTRRPSRGSSRCSETACGASTNRLGEVAAGYLNEYRWRYNRRETGA